MLISMSDIIDEIMIRPNHEQIIYSLSNENYPFAVPSIFTKSDDKVKEYLFAPILKDNKIRFRIDTIDKGLEEHGDKISKEALYAYNVVKSIVTSSKNIKWFKLKSNDMVFLNNNKMLHGRTAFKDEKRHFFRIRINKK